MSKLDTNRAFCSMNTRRGSTSSPMSFWKISSASTASSMPTFNSVRRADVGVRHDDDLVIARLIGLELFLDPGADGRDDRPDLLVREHFVDARLLDVDDLAAQRQDGLEVAPPALLGRAAGRVALDEIELAERRIGERTIGELARQVADIERRLSSREVARLSSRFTRARRRHCFLENDVR